MKNRTERKDMKNRKERKDRKNRKERKQRKEGIITGRKRKERTSIATE